MSRRREGGSGGMDPRQRCRPTGRCTDRRWDYWGERSWRSQLWEQEMVDAEILGRAIAVVWFLIEEREGSACGETG